MGAEAEQINRHLEEIKKEAEAKRQAEQPTDKRATAAPDIKPRPTFEPATKAEEEVKDPLLDLPTDDNFKIDNGELLAGHVRAKSYWQEQNRLLNQELMDYKKSKQYSYGQYPPDLQDRIENCQEAAGVLTQAEAHLRIARPETHLQKELLQKHGSPESKMKPELQQYTRYIQEKEKLETKSALSPADRGRLKIINHRLEEFNRAINTLGLDVLDGPEVIRARELHQATPHYKRPIIDTALANTMLSSYLEATRANKPERAQAVVKDFQRYTQLLSAKQESAPEAKLSSAEQAERDKLTKQYTIVSKRLAILRDHSLPLDERMQYLTIFKKIESNKKEPGFVPHIKQEQAILNEISLLERRLAKIETDLGITTPVAPVRTKTAAAKSGDAVRVGMPPVRGFHAEWEDIKAMQQKQAAEEQKQKQSKKSFWGRGWERIRNAFRG